MPKTISLLEKITEFDCHVESDDDLEEINNKFNCITCTISSEMIRLKKYSENLTNELGVDKNITFEEQELIEEQMDIFIYEYSKLKQLLNQGREIRYHKEEKEKEMKNQKRYARNLLAHYGIEPKEHT
jgi:CRISPR/Cas system-associated protein Csx1